MSISKKTLELAQRVLERSPFAAGAAALDEASCVCAGGRPHLLRQRHHRRRDPCPSKPYLGPTQCGTGAKRQARTRAKATRRTRRSACTRRRVRHGRAYGNHPLGETRTQHVIAYPMPLWRKAAQADSVTKTAIASIAIALSLCRMTPACPALHPKNFFAQPGHPCGHRITTNAGRTVLRRTALPMRRASTVPAGAQIDDNVPESLQFLFDNFGEAALVTKELCLAEESLTAIPRVLRRFTVLQTLDLSGNLFRSLPVQAMNDFLPNLQALDVSNNRLNDMRNVCALGSLPELRDLNLVGNPLLVVNQRPSLIACLLFNRQLPTRKHLEAILAIEPSGRKGGAGAAEDATKPIIVASESVSRMIVSGLEVGHVLPTQAVKVLSTSLGGNSGGVVYADLSPAPVPRPLGTPFRQLTRLNQQVVTKEDVDQAALACCTDGGGAGRGRGYDRSHGSPTRKGEGLASRNQGKEKKQQRLSGKAKEELAEQEMAKQLQARKQKQVLA